jgi:twitching motility two-component system response regulator PilH
MAKILVVDDVDTERLFTSGILRKAGHSILEAKDGAEGVEMARKHLPDVVLMDIVMSGMDGFKAAKELSKDDATKHIPVVIVSSKSQESDRCRAELVKAKGYLVKPVKSAELLEVINGFL